MKKWIIIAVLLTIIVCLSGYLRIVLPYNAVFGSGEVRFPTVDAYTHMRMADWTFEHFPAVMKYDAYLSYPDGAVIGARPLLSLIIATLAKVLYTSTDMIGAWLPPILGILLLVPVFIIALKLFGKWAAVIACLFVAIMPGELVGRTSLGMIDHDALEIFLMILTLMFIVLSFKKNWLYCIGAGIALGLYNLNWVGAPLLTLIFMFYLLVQSIIDRYKGYINTKLYISMVVVFTLGFIGYIVPTSMRLFLPTYTVLYIGAIIFPVIILLLNKWSSKYKPYYYPISLVVIAILGAGAILVISLVLYRGPFLLDMLYQGLVGAFVPQSSGLGMTISEMMPLLYYRGVFSFDAAWAYFGMCSFTGLIGLGWLFYKHWKEPASLLLSIWAMFTIILVVLQRRYGYYAAVSLGILTGYIIWAVCSRISVKTLNRQQRKRGSSNIRYSNLIMSVLFIFLLVLVPIFLGGKATAQSTPYILTDAWSDGLHWIRDNTPTVPETDGQIPAGTSREGLVPQNAAYDRIDSYGIVSWWDYGYWIIREAKRPAIVHPGGGWLLWTSAFLLCKEDNPYLQKYVERFKPRYVIIDYQMVTGKFYAIPEIAKTGIGADIDNVIMQIRGYTDKDYADTLIMKLYYTGKFGDWREVWESRQQYNRQAEVKIFEYIGK